MLMQLRMLAEKIYGKGLDGGLVRGEEVPVTLSGTASLLCGGIVEVVL